MGYEQVTNLSGYGGNNKCGIDSMDKEKFMQNELRKTEKDKYESEKSKYGVWGATLKDRKHFVDMHHC